MNNIELYEKSPIERLTIALTLIDSVMRESDITLVNLALIKCSESINNCIQILDKLRSR